MLIKAGGNCDKCGIAFSGFDSWQSVGVICGSCGKESRRCRKCKAEGCDCGGALLDAWEKFEKKNPGNRIMF